jgi:hypothetical protein
MLLLGLQSSWCWRERQSTCAVALLVQKEWITDKYIIATFTVTECPERQDGRDAVFLSDKTKKKTVSFLSLNLINTCSRRFRCSVAGIVWTCYNYKPKYFLITLKLPAIMKRKIYYILMRGLKLQFKTPHLIKIFTCIQLEFINQILIYYSCLKIKKKTSKSPLWLQ